MQDTWRVTKYPTNKTTSVTALKIYGKLSITKQDEVNVLADILKIF